MSLDEEYEDRMILIRLAVSYQVEKFSISSETLRPYYRNFVSTRWKMGMHKKKNGRAGKIIIA